MISLLPFGVGASGILRIIERKIGKGKGEFIRFIVGVIIMLMGIVLLIE
jgi:hypothetical protein